jgi:phage protein D
MALPRTVKIIVEYDGKDITQAVSNSIINFTYTDKSANEADEISLTVHDREGNWRGDWYPKDRAKSN